MRTLEIRRLFGGNCILSGVCDPPVKVTSVNDLRAKLRQCGVPEPGIANALIELKNERHLTIALREPEVTIQVHAPPLAPTQCT